PISLKESIITPSSSIITLQHAVEISSWIDRSPIINEIPYIFKLLLRGSRDGFSGEKFHKLCDNIPGTVIVAKNNITDEIRGGYNPLVWKVTGKKSERAAITDSFIFSGNQNKSILSRVSNESMAILYGRRSRGPWYGNDFGMEDTSFNRSKTWHCVKGFYHNSIVSVTNSSRFHVDDYEVFQVIHFVKI
ncbi:1777_t:CDS:1, partial [Dentiscutata heterogama]